MTDMDMVLLQNARFYEAVERADLGAMDGLWSTDDSVMCIHPGWDILRGWDHIRASWTNIFSSAERIRITLRNVAGKTSGHLGVIFLEEEITLGPNPALQVVRAITTNAFAFDGTVWKMVLHHASPVLANGEDDLRHRFN